MRNALIGAPVPRREDYRFLTGAGEYVDDLSRPGMLHAAVLRSPEPHGRIRRIDAGRARRTPGVAAILTARDIAQRLGRVPTTPIRLCPLPELECFAQPVIAAQIVRFVGEPVALVLADSRALAEDAAASVELDIEPCDAPLFDAAPDGIAIAYRAAKGDAAAAFANAPYTRSASLSVGRHSAVPMEPRGLLAEWDGARLIVMGAAKASFAVRRALAGQLGLAEDAIAMVENDVGGGFGLRGEGFPEDFLVPFAAWHLGRPVKWIEDRREHLIASAHAREARCDIEIACDRDGAILALRAAAVADIGAYVRTNGTIGPRNIAQFLSGPYRIADIDATVALALTAKSPIGTYRGPGRFEADFFRERLLDLAAADLGIGRAALRRRNLPRAADMPYALARIAPFPREDSLDSGDHVEAFDRCLEAFGWEDNAAPTGRLADGRRVGAAVGPFIEGGAAGPRETARLVLEDDGRVCVHVGSSSLGQGIETAFAQIAADALERPLEAISGVHHGSTSDVGEGFGSYHSRSTVMAGSAILRAAASLKAKIRAAAARRMGCDAAEIRIVDGDRMAGPGGELPLAAIADAGIEAEESFENHRHTYAYGTHAARVAVDAETGAVEVLDYVAVEDAGRIVNPLTLAGQAVGAVVQGIGGALYEDMPYDGTGQPLAATLADYLMPTACESPRIAAILTENHPSPLNPLGVKGAGEGGVIPVGGLIANAVADALGVAPSALPLAPPEIRRLVEGV
ncbi:MAG: xanthine dehydrogenase family protein molybdopterin-binding subunit [Defluviicoccus sp.]|nr:xanthine dehydrogenase family protein molybdopterin-binding subunit [Defluviicoccus sp.]MDE0383312.1 xanthine dehydrogenase family protein molybdopterin-binding subunit [Defluviicoccus sp.]